MQPLPKIDIPGISVYIDRQRKRYRIQFRRGDRKKSLTLSTTHPGTAYQEALSLAQRFDASRFDPWQDPTDRLTVAQALLRYLDDGRRRGLAGATTEQRTTVLQAFERTLPDGLYLDQLRARDCRAYYAAPHRARASRRTYFNILRTWLRWCVSKNLLPQSPMQDAERPRAARGLPAYFKPAALHRLITTIEADLLLKDATLTGAARHHGLGDLPDMIRLSVETGYRRGELLHLRWMEVDLRSRLVHVRAYEDPRRGIRFEPKDTDARVIPLSPTAHALLSRRCEARADENDTTLVFPSVRTGGVRDGRRLSRTFKAYVRRAGLPDNLHWHSLRHTFASWLASSGVPIVRIQRWMGHAKVETTMVYADLLPSALEWMASPFHRAFQEAGQPVLPQSSTP